MEAMNAKSEPNEEELVIQTSSSVVLKTLDPNAKPSALWVGFTGLGFRTVVLLVFLHQMGMECKKCSELRRREYHAFLSVDESLPNQVVPC